MPANTVAPPYPAQGTRARVIAPQAPQAPQVARAQGWGQTGNTGVTGGAPQGGYAPKAQAQSPYQTTQNRAPSFPQQWQAPQQAPQPTSGAPGPYPQTPATPGPAPYQSAKAIQSPGAYNNPYQKGYDQDIYNRQAALIGPATNQLLSSGDALHKGDIPLLQIAENYAQEGKSELDREHGYGELVRGRGSIGGSPEEMLAQQLAMDRSQSGGPFTQQLMEEQQGNIRNQGAMANQDALQSMAEDAARRGMGGGASSYEKALLEQSNASGIQDRLTGFRSQAAQANEAAQQNYLAQLSDIAGRQGGQRAAFDQALANVYLNTERTPQDLSPLMAQVKNANKAVGGGHGKVPGGRKAGQRQAKKDAKKAG